MTENTPEIVEPQTAAEVETPTEGVAVFAGATTHDTTPQEVAVPTEAAVSPASTPAVVTAAPVDPAQVSLPAEATQIATEAPKVVHDTATLISEIHSMVTEIHAAVETVRPLVVDALGNLGSNPLLRMFGGK